MGQKVNPIGFRLGVFKFWNSKWFSFKNNFGDVLKEDCQVRKFLEPRIAKADFSEISIERTGENIRLTIFAARPGVVIGKSGQGIESLKSELEKKFSKKFDVSVKEVRSPDLSAKIVASNIANQIEKRANFKRVIKKAGFSIIKAGAKGVRIRISGRLGGAEIARKEWFRSGSVPLHTLRSNIDYSFVEARTIYGVIGIKVWVCKGEY